MLSAAALLDVWEWGEARSPFGRGAALVAASSPELTVEALAVLSIGEREERLLAIRTRLFGPTVTGLVVCPHCGVRVEIEFDSRELGVSSEARRTREFQLTVGGLELCCRLPSGADVEAVSALADVDAVCAALLARCVTARDVAGNVVPAAALPAEVVRAIGDEMDRLDPLAVIRLPVECPSCGGAWEAALDVQSFVWTELRAWARRTLREVHALARAYGWTEAEVLALSATRRRAYLELVAQ